MAEKASTKHEGKSLAVELMMLALRRIDAPPPRVLPTAPLPLPRKESARTRRR